MKLVLGLWAVTLLAADPDAGQKLYGAACAGCHGQTGEGGRGPKLADGRLLRRATDQRLRDVIRNGVPGSDMPPFPMAEAKVADIVAFLRSFSTPAVDAKIAGNAASGRDLFYGKGKCSSCHMIRGEGGFLGPDLTNAGATMTLKQLRESVTDPDARIADGYLPVTVVTKKGEKVRGIAKNWNNYSLQVLDERGKLHMFDAADVAQIESVRKSLMPPTRLSAPEMQDLLAFLAKQAIRPRENR